MRWYRRCISLLQLMAPLCLAFSNSDNAQEIVRQQSGAERRLTVEHQKKTTERSAPANPLGDHYLMLINTAIASLMTQNKFSQFEKSPYNGIAVAFLHAYDVGAVPSSEQMEAHIKEWKQRTSKDIWPWVYINRMLAVDPSDKNPYSKDAYFRNFSGADLDGKAGAQKDFLELWKNSLRAAKDSQAPGIVFDPEFYNFQAEYDVGLLAEQTRKKPEEVVLSLQKLGTAMADIAAEEHPEAILWFMFTGLGYPDYKMIDNRPFYPSPAYITLGLLNEIQAKRLHLRVISGGEGSLGYCHETLAQFQAAIDNRARMFASLLQKYPNTLELGGTLTLWSDSSQKRGWVRDGACGTATAANVEELQPYLELVLKSFRYNWIYGSTDGGYDAFSPQTAPRFDSVIQKAKTRTYRSAVN